MLTGETITDVQIQELRAALGREYATTKEGLDYCYAALFRTAKHPNDPDYPDEIQRARARCAEIWNKRTRRAQEQL